MERCLVVVRLMELPRKKQLLKQGESHQSLVRLPTSCRKQENWLHKQWSECLQIKIHLLSDIID